ncbi:MAG: M48 family metallopeptidase [Burkholderiaceae bacterium]
MSALFDIASTLTVIFAIFLVGNVATQLWLNSRQARHVWTHRDQVPAAFAQSVSLTDHQKAAAYTIAKLRLANWSLLLNAVILLAWNLMGGLDALNTALLTVLGAGMSQQLALLACVTLIGAVLDLPLSWWRTFKLEAEFGFNKSTFKLWISDLLKGAVLGAALGLPLAWVALWLMATAGPLWWLYVWGVWAGFNALMLVIYPKWIAPRFNKFSPLTREDVRETADALIAQCGFKSEGLFVMDGSRRSAHANAYFTGFGKSKRVVFYDTLLDRLTVPEVKAVLAHELGHFAHRHIRKRLVGLFAISAGALAILSWLANQLWFYVGLGVTPNLTGPNDAVALILFMFTLPLITFFISPLLAGFSRKDEFEADAYACQHAEGTALQSALTKLYKDNASTLTPDPIYTRFYASHPAAIERIQRIASAV